MNPARAAEEAVVGTPLVQKLSFAAYGMPSRGPRRFPIVIILFFVVAGEGGW